VTTARRFQCITLPSDSVAMVGEDFDNMVAELSRLQGPREPPHCATCTCGMHKEKDGADSNETDG
jgi:hypothetical protein